MSELATLTADEAIGVEVERFITGPVGRAMVEKWEAERAAALERLATIDPEDARAIRAAQNEVAVIDRIQQTLSDMLTQARVAIARLDALSSED